VYERNSDSVSVVVPVYNSAGCLRQLTEAVYAALSEGQWLDFELILVNDGSIDASWSVISALADENDWVKGINFTSNYGQQHATVSGIRAAVNDIIVTMDDDLQYPPFEILELLRKLQEGYDLVYGTPRNVKQTFLRVLGSSATRMLLERQMGRKAAHQISSFRAFRSVLAHAFTSYESSSVHIDLLLFWATNSFTSVPVRHEVRKFGRSGYTFSKLVKQAFAMITGSNQSSTSSRRVEKLSYIVRYRKFSVSDDSKAPERMQELRR
jgi:undecaprenyl-phosphate 4-deoxy-4-formamido-L-arabinose transferase